MVAAAVSRLVARMVHGEPSGGPHGRMGALGRHTPSMADFPT
eukprot:SAG31_NODE_1384_length_8578_cov_2.883359_9_plen_42_part_00